MEPQNKIIGNNIMKFRYIKNLSQENLALEAEISLSNLRQIEKGVANPTIHTLLALAKPLDVTVIDLIYSDADKIQEIRKFYELVHTLPPKAEAAIMDMLRIMIHILQDREQ